MQEEVCTNAPTKTFSCGWSVLKCYSSATELVGINPEWFILELYFSLWIISQVSSREKQIVILLKLMRAACRALSCCCNNNINV